ncbi:hypothetical protein Sa4125_25950 [Aureimonas sp. SA4125]|uniref:DUF2259 domain-containing protein n=1 Tax=Aureimonas sp. SA4125 TaxID=2826993 RepID=UPI001CC6F09E|nr:DUF2259 domain-containing protein [Aureimonas sp. SA4125]BDA85053.1 hypothetical protein Sa4125_25950 [Aureimonas sp. SA4125]
MRRRSAFLATCLALAGTPAALAGDIATLEPIGFSADGRIYAFEQYGIHDGSGFPYAEIIGLDLATDTFVKPTPVAIEGDDDQEDLAVIRKKARTAAAPLLQKLGAKPKAGYVAADNPVTELSANPARLTFLPRPIEPTPDQPIELRLQRIPFPTAPGCAGVTGEDLAGFRLTRIGPGKTTKVLHEDKAIPKSRGCALDYRLSRVVVFPGEGVAQRAVLLIAVKSIGFEGPNIDFLAYPVPLD